MSLITDELKQQIKKNFNQSYKNYSSNEDLKNLNLKIHGEDLGQYNELSKNQLTMLLKNLKNDNTNTLLDLGCGLGLTTEYISKKLSIKVTGIDFSKDSIAIATKRTIKNNNINFLEMDFDKLNFNNKKFDAIISIDTVYFSNNLEKLIKNLRQITNKNGKWYFFVTQLVNYENTTSEESTPMSKILENENMIYKKIDFTKESCDFWKMQHETIQNIRKEKNDNSLLSTSYKEAEFLLSYININKLNRYLYVVENN